MVLVGALPAIIPTLRRRLGAILINTGFGRSISQPFSTDGTFDGIARTTPPGTRMDTRFYATNNN